MASFEFPASFAQRRMWEDTLVVCCTEFGRTPGLETRDGYKMPTGRDHTGTLAVNGKIPAALGMGLVIKDVAQEFTAAKKATKAYDDAVMKHGKGSEQAAKKLKELDVGAMPICGEDDRLKGMLTDRDIVVKVLAQGKDPARTTVGELRLVANEERIAAEAMRVPGARGNVLIVGHPYVDVWQVIKPAVLGIEAWPVVPRGQDWKTGILKGLGWPHRTKEDVGLGWKRLLSRVRTYADLEPALLGRVEEVIDFLTAVGD